MFRYKVDYTTYTVGSKTKDGTIERCPQCGKPGVYRAFQIGGNQFEKWMHTKEGTFLLRNSVGSCVRQLNATDQRGQALEDGRPTGM